MLEVKVKVAEVEVIVDFNYFKFNSLLQIIIYIVADNLLKRGTIKQISPTCL